jgi:hypothetical protein
MIARVWHGFTKPVHSDAYESHLKPELLPGLSQKQGFRGSYLHIGGHTITLLTASNGTVFISPATSLKRRHQALDQRPGLARCCAPERTWRRRERDGSRQ